MKTHAPSLTPQGKFDWNWLNFAQMRQRDTISSNSEAHLVLCPFSTTDDGFIRSRSLFLYIWPRNIPALWKFIIKYRLCGQIISENNQVNFVHNYSHWKQLSLATIEPQKSYDDSNLTDKWHHPIATGPGEFLSFRLALARDERINPWNHTPNNYMLKIDQLLSFLPRKNECLFPLWLSYCSEEFRV